MSHTNAVGPPLTVESLQAALVELAKMVDGPVGPIVAIYSRRLWRLSARKAKRRRHRTTLAQRRNREAFKAWQQGAAAAVTPVGFLAGLDSPQVLRRMPRP